MNQLSSDDKLRVVVLISGRGSNLASIIDSMATGQLSISIDAVISNRPDAAGLELAKQQGIETHVVDHTLYPDRLSFDQAMMKCIDSYNPQLIVLAGFMRLLTTEFVHHYLGRLINIHPSLLPKYRGLNTHQQALDDRATVHGASVHFVTPELDGGPVIAQAVVPVKADDDASTLAERVLSVEHSLYPKVIEWFAAKRLHMQDMTTILFDDHPMRAPIIINEASGETCQDTQKL